MRRTLELYPGGDERIYIVAKDATCLLRELAHGWRLREFIDSRLDFDTMDAVAVELEILADQIDVACVLEVPQKEKGM
ncbi:DUF6213 family protein (plasmid) [Streptomyces sp. JL4002]|uniref:DUF6213 family protein n=1 Tax=Streptomyces sp. JL4002 TaxID=3404781 RepID=UPI003B28326D